MSGVTFKILKTELAQLRKNSLFFFLNGENQRYKLPSGNLTYIAIENGHL